MTRLLSRSGKRAAIRPLAASLTMMLLSSMSLAAQDQSEWDAVTLKTEQLTDNIHVIFGRGGNIAVMTGEDGTILIDDQFAPLTEKLKAVIKTLHGGPVRFVINTHFHGDHTGGNENLGKEGAVIVAHDQVRQRLAAGSLVKAFNKKTDPQAKTALPVVTFNDSLSLHVNGDELRAVHVEHAHTDGDSLIFFKKANVAHMGDGFFSNGFPFIDISNGGSIDGLIAGMEKALSLVDDKTKIIPGHGPVADKAGLRAYRDMLKEARARIAARKQAGESLEALQKDAEVVLKGLNKAPIDDWARRFIEFIYQSLS